MSARSLTLAIPWAWHLRTGVFLLSLLVMTFGAVFVKEEETMQIQTSQTRLLGSSPVHRSSVWNKQLLHLVPVRCRFLMQPRDVALHVAHTPHKAYIYSRGQIVSSKRKHVFWE